MELPVLTSAPETKFCVVDVQVGPELLFLDGNQKITWGNGTYEDPRPNAFSLVQVADCPGATPACKENCYIHQLEKYRPDVHDLYKSNSLAIRRILAGPPEAIDVSASDMALAIRRRCRGGFRWHVSGDIFSAEYADFIAQVCRWSPRVRHWIYTRSFHLVTPALTATSTQFGGNLAVNLSCDRDNYDAACRLHSAAWFRLCYLTSDGEVPRDLPRGSVIFPDYTLRGKTEEGRAWFAGLPPHQKAMVCPVDRLGKSEKIRCGPCRRCLK